MPIIALVLLLSSIDPTIAPQPTSPSGPPTGPPPTVNAQGTLDQQSVRYYIRLQQPAVRTCYEQEIGRQPNLKVAVAVDFTVASNGRVSQCTQGTSALEKCVSKVVCAVRFPQVFDSMSDGSSQLSSGTTQVRYRFKFQPLQRDRLAASPPVVAARKAARRAVTASQPASAPATQRVTPPGPPRPPGTRVPPPRHVIPPSSGDDPLEGIQDGDLL